MVVIANRCPAPHKPFDLPQTLDWGNGKQYDLGQNQDVLNKISIRSVQTYITNYLKAAFGRFAANDCRTSKRSPPPLLTAAYFEGGGNCLGSTLEEQFLDLGAETTSLAGAQRPGCNKLHGDPRS